MEKENIIENVDECDVVDEKDEYTPRNSIVAAKETLYDRTNLTVGQVDKFICFCIAAIIVIIIAGLNM